MLIDCHVHRPGRPDATLEMLESQEAIARAQGVRAWIVQGTTLPESREVLDFIDGRDGYFACVGVHPSQSDSFTEDSVAELAELAESNDRVVGIGEVGVDFQRSPLPQELQVDVFRRQIGLARDLGLPLNLHTYGRESAQVLADVLKEEHAWEVGGVLHNFMGSEDLAGRLLDMGIYPSVSVVLMHPDAHRLRNVYRSLPLGGLVMDTDWPAGILERTGEGAYPLDLDEKTELVNLVRFTERLAEEKEVSFDHVASVIERNVRRAFPKLQAGLGLPSPSS